MPLQVDAADEPALNLTPLVDVLFLLLIFFLVGTRFTQNENSFEIDLPTAAAAPEPMTGQPDELVVNVGPEGQLTLLGEPLSIERLRERLAEFAEVYPDQVVVVRGDASGAYQHVVTVMDAVNQAGLTNLSLAVDPVRGDAAAAVPVQTEAGPTP
ncbi:ExbD/TolR family protein [Alienimonas sp. DA493]|uniref:ExbD/TolR family protein n=1 Tax=Alienimonas sp. DA493 TaxID=3373605 RepID=UPI003753EC65